MMNDNIETFLKQDHVAATATTSFLKYVGEGYMQEGLRTVYRCGEVKGAVVATIGMCVVGVGGYICKEVASKVIVAAKTYRSDKKKIKDAVSKTQIDATMDVDTSKENKLS